MSGLPFVAHWRNVVRDSTELDARAKFVGLTLSTYMNAAGVCYPARPTLAEACCCGVQTIDRAVARIESAGLLDVSRTGGGRGYANVYRATLNGVTGDALSGEEGRHQRAERASPEGVKGVTGDAPKRVKASELSTLANARERAARAGRKTGAQTRAVKKRAPVEIDPELLIYDE